MKKIFSMMIAVICILQLACPAMAMHESNGPFDSLPEGWTVSDDNNNSSLSYEEFDGEQSMLLSCDTASNTAASITLKTNSYEPGGDFVLHMRTGVNLSLANVNKRVRVESSGGEISELFNFVQNKLRLFGAKEEITIENDRLYDLQLAVSPKNGTAVMWLDGNKVYDGETGISAEQFEKFNIVLYHGYSRRKTSSKWHISKLEMSSSGAFNLRSNPEDKSENIDAEALEKISVDFGTVMCPGIAENIELKKVKNDEESDVPFTCEQAGSTFNIVPETIEESVEYRLSFKNLTDAFGNEYDDCEITFKTAEAGFEAAKVRIVSPENGTSFPSNYSFNVEAEVTEGSYAIDKVQLLVNGETVKETEDSNYSFSLSVPEAGRYTVSIKVFDASGASVISDPIEISIFVNKIPSVIMSVSDGDELNPGSRISYKAEDEDGTIQSVEVCTDGTLISSSEESEGIIEIPEDMNFGVHNITVIAYDNYGQSGEASADIVVSQTMDAVIMSTDFSGFKYSKSSPDSATYAGLLVLTGGLPHYIMSDEIDGRKCMVLGADDKSYIEGKYNAYMHMNYTPPSTLDLSKEFTWRMRVYIDKQQTLSDIVIRSNDSSAVFINNIHIADGVIKCENNKKVASTADISSGEWHDLEYNINLASGTYSFFMDGKQLADNFTFTERIDSVSYLRVSFQNNDEGEAKMGMSLFEVTQNLAYPYIESGEFKEGLASKELTLYPGSPIDTSNFDIKGGELYCEGIKQEIESFSVNNAGDEITVGLKNPVQQGCDYTVYMNYTALEKNYTVSYTVTAPYSTDLGIKNAEFVKKEDKIAFSADIVKSGEEQNIVIILAKYDSKGAMEECVWANGSVNGEQSLTTPYIRYTQESTYRAYVRDSWNTLIPINKKVYKTE